MGKAIEEFIRKEFSISEAKLKEIEYEKVVKILKKFDFKKGKDFKIVDKQIFLTSEDVAMKVSDELVDDYVVTYDDQDDFKLSVFA